MPAGRYARHKRITFFDGRPLVQPEASELCARRDGFLHTARWAHISARGGNRADNAFAPPAARLAHTAHAQRAAIPRYCVSPRDHETSFSAADADRRARSAQIA